MKTKKTFTFTQLLMTTVAIGLMAMPALPARADSFQPTNVINSAVVILSDPTNSLSANTYTVIQTNTVNGTVSTNTATQGQQTGSAITIPNQTKLGLYMQGYNATTTASKLTMTLIRAGSQTPVLTTSERDWETTPMITWTVTTPAAVGPFYFYTNLDDYNIGAPGDIGISQLTNNSVSASVTNFDAGVIKKIVPIRYP